MAFLRRASSDGTAEMSSQNISSSAPEEMLNARSSGVVWDFQHAYRFRPGGRTRQVPTKTSGHTVQSSGPSYSGGRVPLHVSRTSWRGSARLRNLLGSAVMRSRRIRSSIDRFQRAVISALENYQGFRTTKTKQYRILTFG